MDDALTLRGLGEVQVDGAVVRGKEDEVAGLVTLHAGLDALDASRVVNKEGGGSGL